MVRTFAEMMHPFKFSSGKEVMLRSVTFVLLCFWLQPVFAQSNEKRERETKVSESAAPQPAKDWLRDATDGTGRLTWYEQMSDGAKNFEVKFNYQKEFYSVEFDLDGNIENIEILRKWRNLPKAAREQMEAYLDSTYSKHKLKKAQVQYTGESARLKTVFSEDISAALTVKYEVVYRGRDQNEDALWESLFDSEGIHLYKRKVILRPVDNLNY